MPAVEPLLTVKEVGRWLQVQPRTIYQWVHEGYIPVKKLGTLVRFEQASVEAWLKKRDVPGRANRRPEIDVT